MHSNTVLLLIFGAAILLVVLGAVGVALVGNMRSERDRRKER